MVSPEGIEKAQPATLPADFSEWDSGEAPAAEPAKPATARVAVPPVAERMPVKQPYSPAPVYEDVEKLFQPRQSDERDAAEAKHKAESKRKRTLLFGSLGSVAVLLILGSVGYLRMRSAPVMPKTPVMAPTTVMNLPQPPAATNPAPQPAVASKPSAAPVADTSRSLDAQSERMNSQLSAPSRIPTDLKILGGKELPPSSGFTAGMDGLGGNTGVNVFNGRSGPSVKVESSRAMTISAGVAGGLLIQKTAPVYPQIAKEARVSGTVVIQATISKTGSIKNLRAVNGPTMLRQAAIDAVKGWRYRPYLLDGEPVEVETTVSVTFNLGG